MKFSALPFALTPVLHLPIANRSRRSKLARLILLAIVCCQPLARAKEIGRPPELGTAARDVAADFRLPPLHDGPGSDLAARFSELQVGKRARELKLNARSACEAWMAADATLQSARMRLSATPPAGARSFDGMRASELNILLRDPAVQAVKVRSPHLEMDEPVLLRRAKFWLDLGTTELRAAEGGPRFLLRVENTSEVTVSGGTFMGGQWGMLVDGSQDVIIQGGRYVGLQFGGIVFNNAPRVVLAHVFLTQIGGAPVLIHGDTSGSVVIDNEIIGNRGPSNWHAGVVISDRNGMVADDPQSILNADHYGAREQLINTRLHVPRRNILAYNHIALNASSGIYSDGGIETVIFNNTVEGNAKEGVCLDNGSSANVMAMNVVRLNGQRWGKTDSELKLDFVDGLGRLPDGSSPAKTPGISLDNSFYNVVYANQIERNYGGGVKMVRTAYFNIIGLNTIVDNNQGKNERFHFFGVELGAAKADVPVTDLDFTPCQGNIVFGNTIRGAHYAGIFLGPGSTENDIFDNTVFGATNWAMEQVIAQPNASLNNLTNLPSRNISAGIDANLLKISGQ